MPWQNVDERFDESGALLLLVRVAPARLKPADPSPALLRAHLLLLLRLRNLQKEPRPVQCRRFLRHLLRFRVFWRPVIEPE